MNERDSGVSEDRASAAAVGAPVRRVDGDDKVTGRAVYLDDLRVPGVLHAARPGALTVSVSKYAP